MTSASTSKPIQKTIEHQKCPVCFSKDLKLALPTHDHSVSKEDFQLHDCQACGFRFTQHIPVPEEIGRYYKSEDYISHSDTKEGLVNKLYHFVRDFMLERKFKLVNQLSNHKSLLDIGCGTGYFANHVKNKGYRVEAVEVDADARAFAKKNFNLDIQPTDALFNNKLKAPFGTITMWHVLEHVHDLDAYFKTISQLLEDDGHLVIAVPNHTSYDGTYYKDYWAAYDVPRHLWHFSPSTMQKLAERNGFKIKTHATLPFDCFYVALLSEKYKGNSLFMLSGFIRGGISYLKSLMDVKQSSSVIYVMEKG